MNGGIGKNLMFMGVLILLQALLLEPHITYRFLLVASMSPVNGVT